VDAFFAAQLTGGAEAGDAAESVEPLDFSNAAMACD
jgi:hypothetical protein